MKNDRLFDAMELLDENLITEAGMLTFKKKKMRTRRLTTLMLAAALSAALFVTAGAAVKASELDLAVLNYMGLGSSSSTQLADGMVEIDASDTITGTNLLTGEDTSVTFCAVNSIGDTRTACIRIDTDLTAPDGFDPEHDYYMFGDGPEIIKNESTAVCGSVTEACYDESTGTFYFMLTIDDLKNINRSRLTISFSDLYLYHDRGIYDDSAPEEELVMKGVWTLSWKYAYRSQKNEKSVNVSITHDGTETVIKKVMAAPLGIRLSGRGSSDLSVESITLTDGSIIPIFQKTVWGESESNGSKTFSVYIGFNELGCILNPDEVSAVTVNGTTINLQ